MTVGCVTGALPRRQLTLEPLRKPTDADMVPHNWGGGEARPKGGGG